MSTNYEQFMEANQALTDCFTRVSPEAYSSMSLDQQNELCHSQRTAVMDHLRAGHADFKNVLLERIASLETQKGE